MIDLTMSFSFLSEYSGVCDECGEPADDDAQTVVMEINGSPPLHFHQVCALKRATFAFGELF